MLQLVCAAAPAPPVFLSLLPSTSGHSLQDTEDSWAVMWARGKQKLNEAKLTETNIYSLLTQYIKSWGEKKKLRGRFELNTIGTLEGNENANSLWKFWILARFPSVSLGEIKELPMALGVAWDLCRAPGSAPAAEELPARAEDEELQTFGI